MRAFLIPYTRLPAVCRAAGRHRGCRIPCRARDTSDNSNEYPETTMPTIWPPSSNQLLRARLPWSPLCRCRCLVEFRLHVAVQSRPPLHTRRTRRPSGGNQCRAAQDLGTARFRSYRTSMAASARLLIAEQWSRKPLQRKPDEPARG